MATHVNEVISPKLSGGKLFGDEEQDWRYRRHELHREFKFEKKIFPVVRTELLEKCRIVGLQTMST